jgi:glycosyltransferase involved in cell wall biosynthesis
MPRYGVIVPACNEAACLAAVLDELHATLPTPRFVVAVGVNGSTDATAGIARKRGVVVGETSRRGYGHGCQAAIDALVDAGEAVDGYVFYAADGANPVEDLLRVIATHENTGAGMTLGLRRFDFRTWWGEFGRALPNLLLGLAAWPLSGRLFHDLGPLRVIDRGLFERMQLREMTFGWTIEAQVKAARLGAHVVSVPVVERERLAGEQKVSGVSPWRSARIGAAILAAGVRAKWAPLGEIESNRRDRS